MTSYSVQITIPMRINLYNTNPGCNDLDEQIK